VLLMQMHMLQSLRKNVYIRINSCHDSYDLNSIL
jgi:hypothetical protein